MKRINPIYFIFLFLTMVFISFYLLNNYKKEYEDKLVTLDNINEKAKDYKNLTTTWNDKNFVQETINKILQNSIFKDSKITKNIRENYLQIKIESDDTKVLDNFLNRILNKKLIIQKLELKKDYIDLQVGNK